MDLMKLTLVKKCWITVKTSYTYMCYGSCSVRNFTLNCQLRYSLIWLLVVGKYLVVQRRRMVLRTWSKYTCADYSFQSWSVSEIVCSVIKWKYSQRDVNVDVLMYGPFTVTSVIVRTSTSSIHSSNMLSVAWVTRVQYVWLKTYLG